MNYIPKSFFPASKLSTLDKTINNLWIIYYLLVWKKVMKEFIFLAISSIFNTDDSSQHFSEQLITQQNDINSNN